MNSKAIASYRTQQVSAASPEKQAALLMEAGQVHLFRAIVAIQDKKYNDLSKALNTLCDILDEASSRLDYNSPNELVDNLSTIYIGWRYKLIDIAKTKNISTLELMSTQFGEIKKAWEQVK